MATETHRVTIRLIYSPALFREAQIDWHERFILTLILEARFENAIKTVMNKRFPAVLNSKTHKTGDVVFPADIFA